MPLSQQLKSEMTSIPLDASQKKESESINMTDFSSAIDAQTSETDVVPSSETLTPASNQMSLLLSIESQLESLNDNIFNLVQVITNNKNIDFSAIFTKIDVTRMSIEKLISMDNTQSTIKTSNLTSQLSTLLQSILEKQERNDRQLAQSLRDNANFQIQVRQGMQIDLDKLKEQINGEQFNPLLKEIASVYVEYQSLLDDETISDHSRKYIQSLFEQLKDILSEYGAEVCRSEVGSVRQTKICKVIEKKSTGQSDRHNTIAASRKPGVIRDHSVLYPEFVDVFVYDPSLNEELIPITEEVQKNIDTLYKDNLGGNE